MLFICLFLLISLCPCLTFHFLFVTHVNELQRVTNTAGICQRNLPSDQITTLVWRGRGCNDRMGDEIEALMRKHYTTYLVFTDKWSNAMPISSLPFNSSSTSTSNLYIILDSTWTEARNLYRKGPSILRNLPLLSIDDGGKSTYTLRRNFGFVSKFTKSMGVDEDVGVRYLDRQIPVEHGLLCTAECVCRILKHESRLVDAAKIMEELAYMQTQAQTRRKEK